MKTLINSNSENSPVPVSEIRKATRDDLPWITLVTWQILVETGRTGVYRFRDVLYGVQSVLRDSTLGEYFVAEADGQYAGQLKLVRGWHDLFNRDVATIEHVYVHPRYRSLNLSGGQRVYDQLHQHALQVCRERHVHQVQLHVVSDNKRAQRAYEKRGMQSTGLWMTQRLADE